MTESWSDQSTLIRARAPILLDRSLEEERLRDPAGPGAARASDSAPCFAGFRLMGSPGAELARRSHPASGWRPSDTSKACPRSAAISSASRLSIAPLLR